jgi:uncharacterized Zn finger protein (UPF0148 family)
MWTEMHCENCGAPIHCGVEYCPVCGYDERGLSMEKPE